MRAASSGNRFRGLTSAGQLNDRRGVFVAGIKSVIGPGDENPAPLHQASGKEAGDGAEDDLLNERSLHFP